MKTIEEAATDINDCLGDYMIAEQHWDCVEEIIRERDAEYEAAVIGKVRAMWPRYALRRLQTLIAAIKALGEKE